MVEFNTRNYNKPGAYGKVRLRADQYKALAQYFGVDPKERKIPMPGNIELLRVHGGWYTLRPAINDTAAPKRQAKNMIFAIRLCTKALATVGTQPA